MKMRFLCCLCWLFVFEGGLFAAPGEVLWRYDTKGEIFGAAAVDGSGSIYVGSRSRDLYALNADGSLKWSFRAGDWVDSSPALSRDEQTVYFGSWDNKLYAVRASDGQAAWAQPFETGSLIVGSPAVGRDGAVYVGSGDGFLYAVNPDGTPRWEYYVDSEIDSSPALAVDGSVYFGAYDGALYALDADGSLKWKFQTANNDPDRLRIKGSPTVDALGYIYFGAGNGSVYCLRPDGTERWSFQADETVDTGIVMASNGDVIFGCRDGNLYRVREGSLVWSSFVGDIFYSTPAVDASDNIYVGCYVGLGVSSLTAVEGSDGDILWTHLVYGYADSSPSLTPDGRVIFGGYDGYVYSLDTGGQFAIASDWSQFGGGLANRSFQGDLGFSWYDDWVEQLGLSGPAADPAYQGSDGLSALIEFAVGGHPDQADPLPLRVEGADAGTPRIALTVRKRLGDVELWVALSRNGKDWERRELDATVWPWTILEADPLAEGSFERWSLPLEAPYRLARIGAALRSR